MKLVRIGVAVAAALGMMSVHATSIDAIGDDGFAKLDVLETQLLRAVQRRDTRKLDEVIGVLEKRQRRAGTDAGTLVLLVRAYLERSPHYYGRKAFEAAERAIRLDPANPDAHLAKALIGIQLDCEPCAQTAIADAEKLGRPTAAIHSTRAAAHLLKARSVAREPGSGSYVPDGKDAVKLAADELGLAITRESRPVHRSALVAWKAQVVARTGTEAERIGLLKDALAIDPENVAALRQYAIHIAYDKGEIERAAKLIAPLGDLGDSTLRTILASAPYTAWARAWSLAPDADGTTRLLEAARKGAPESDEIFQFVSMQARYGFVARAMLASGVYTIGPMEYRDKDGDTALANAVLNAGEGTEANPGAKRLPKGALETVDALLAAGANPNAWVSRGREPMLCAAARNGDLPVIERLLAAGADPHAIASNGTTALLAASQGEDHGVAVAIAKLFLDRHARVEVNDRFNHSPLMAASRAGNVQLVKMLLDARADIGRKDVDGQTALDWAAAAGHIEIVRALLDAGAELNETTDARGRLTTIDRATRSGNKALVELLKAQRRQQS